MACMAAADARAHAFDELCTACDKRSALRWRSQFRCRVARCDWRLADESERSRGMACAEDLSGRGASLPGARAHKVVERVAPLRADDAVTAERDIAKRTSLSITTRNAAIRLDGARYNKLHIPLLCGHRHSPPAKRSH